MLEALLGPPLDAAAAAGPGGAGGGGTVGGTIDGPVLWEWVERRNKAMAFPTDFAVIRLEVGPGGLCSPRHHPHLRPSFLDLNSQLMTRRK